MSVFLSVIIPTYQREAVLRQTLASLLEQDYPHLEVLVVDQTPQHEVETEAYLQKCHEAGDIRWFRVEWANLPAARNYGIRRACGEVVVFIDDDVVLPSGFLWAHARNYQHPETAAVAGRVLDAAADAPLPQPPIHLLPPQAMDPGVAWYYLDFARTIQPQAVITTRGCNMSFRRSLFTHHQLWFDERFTGHAIREESDLCLRLRRTGLQIWYDPEARLWHRGEATGGCHTLAVRSPQYQISFYQHHVWMALKNLTPTQQLRFALRLFDCHVLGHAPCCKSGHPLTVLARAGFYLLGSLRALALALQSSWDDGQQYSRQDSRQNANSRH
ncbi:MAG: hormogonium polysaccharide biosynthesis glycosyltransferase HpsN [Kaiparowitsia implicata GSE-PSE-MK54-09C]|jgi:GT2 family glycosyltransferase|nr:hormogonium polysaccharide biosynthesis glycosyltransferase HpsN [Kaiparowitsia implicata GSE-PSE-MK54-09C]